MGLERASSPAHLATAAMEGSLSAGSCRVCPRNATWCRGKHPLNGREAAAEYVRNLRTWARERVLGMEE